jgi:hypothetical protein
MPNELIFDDYCFEKTAQAVFIMNDSIRDLYDSWEEVRDFMETMARLYSRDSNHFGTAGFVLTGFDGVDGRRHVTASVSSHVALLYASKFTG